MPNFLGKLKSVKNFTETGKTVLLRADFNEGCDESGHLCEDSRIRAALPTIEYLAGLNSRVIIISHRGRPDGKKDLTQTLQPAAEHLAKLLKRKFVEVPGDDFKFPNYPMPHVFFVTGDVRKLTREQVENIHPGSIVVFENIRFYAEEEKLDDNFAKKLAALGDAYVNEAFSVDHHGATSLSLIPKHLPSFAGTRLIEEIKALDFSVTSARKPLVLVIGGAKISDKAKMLGKLLPQSDYILTGGATANLFLLVKNYEIGDSLVEQEGLQVASQILRNYKKKIILPSDVIVTRDIEAGPGNLKLISNVEPGEKIVDIGPETIFKYSDYIKKANTIIWNGPLGIFENKSFAHGTLALARLIASRARGKAYALVGGGETVQALSKTQMNEYIDFISTGGGAMLSYLGSEPMPGIEALI